jgi:hypothetical protein
MQKAAIFGLSDDIGIESSDARGADSPACTTVFPNMRS